METQFILLQKLLVQEGRKIPQEASLKPAEEQIYLLWPLHLQGGREGTISECEQISQFPSSYNTETCHVHQSLL